MPKEPVRTSITKAVAETKGETSTKHPRIGLARVPSGVQFRCGECEYFEDGVCQNEDPELNGKKVDAVLECCDLYDHEGMERLID